MNRFVLFLSVAAFATSVVAQAPAAKPATTAKPASSTAKPATAAAATSAPEVQPWIKLPPGVPRVVHGLVKIPFALRYEDIKVGTGAAGEAGARPMASSLTRGMTTSSPRLVPTASP
jgi:hypothetical protein